MLRGDMNIWWVEGYFFHVANQNFNSTERGKKEKEKQVNNCMKI